MTNSVPPTGEALAQWVHRVLQIADEVKRDPLRFAKYKGRPNAFCREVLGVTLWAKQKDVLRAAAKFRRVAVRSGHGVGKTFVVACLVLYWLFAEQGLVITTAPTWKHVEEVLWREINTLFKRSVVPLPGDISQTELRIDNTWYAIGLSTAQPDAFQGRHHPRLLVVVDEAPGVSEQVLLEVSTLATGRMNVIVYIGNPTPTSGSFYTAFKHPELWHLMAISCFEHPNVVEGRELIPGAVTREWIEEQRATWGEGHPWWFSRVLGEFPKISNRGVIPLGDVERSFNAEKRDEAIREAVKDAMPIVAGLDVSRYGQNRTVIISRSGDAILDADWWMHKSTMETVGRVVQLVEQWKIGTLVVDSSGVGGGVVDRLIELNIPVVAYNGGHRAFTPNYFTNRRSEMWWHLRQRFEQARIWLPKRLEQTPLLSDLVSPEYDVISSGKVRVETKEALLERGVPSPDFADALVLCFAADEDPTAELEATAGERQDPMAFEEEQQPDTIVEQSDFHNLPAGF